MPASFGGRGVPPGYVDPRIANPEVGGIVGPTRGNNWYGQGIRVSGGYGGGYAGGGGGGGGNLQAYQGPTQYDDPFGAMGALRGYLDSPLGSQGTEAIATAGNAAMQQFNRSTGSRAGDLASRAMAARGKMETGASIARQKFDDYNARIALRASFLDPIYNGPGTSSPAVAGGYQGPYTPGQPQPPQMPYPYPTPSPQPQPQQPRQPNRWLTRR